MSYRNRLSDDDKRIFDTIVVSLQTRGYKILKAIRVAKFSMKRKKC